MESFVKCLLLRRIYVFGVWHSLRHAIFVGRLSHRDICGCLSLPLFIFYLLLIRIVTITSTIH